MTKYFLYGMGGGFALALIGFFIVLNTPVDNRLINCSQGCVEVEKRIHSDEWI